LVLGINFGLKLVKDLVNLLGGSVKIKSTLRFGTTVYFSIKDFEPANKCEKEKLRVKANESMEVCDIIDTSSNNLLDENLDITYPVKSTKLSSIVEEEKKSCGEFLIVDDTSYNITILKTMLQNLGRTTDEVNHFPPFIN
jgi:hypothetical protein